MALRVSRRPPPNHINPDFWPEVCERVSLLAQELAVPNPEEFRRWWDKLSTAAGNANAYATKGNPEQVALTIVQEYQRRATRR